MPIRNVPSVAALLKAKMGGGSKTSTAPRIILWEDIHFHFKRKYILWKIKSLSLIH